MSEEIHYRTILDLEYDPRKARETQRAVQGARGDLRDLADEASLADRVFDRLGKQGGTLGDALGGATRQTRDLNEELEETRRKAEDAGNALSDAGKKGGGRGDVLGKTETALSSVAALVGGTPLADIVGKGADVLQVVDTFKALRAELVETAGAAGLGKLIGVLGPVGIAAGVAAAAIVVTTQRLDEMRLKFTEQSNALQAQTDQERRVAEIRRTMTSEQIRQAEALAAEEDQRRRQEREDQLQLAAQQTAQAVESANFISAFGIALGLTQHPAQQAIDRTNELNEQVEQAGQELEALRVALQQATAPDVIQGAQAAADAERQRAQLMRTASVPATEALIAATQDHLDALDAQIAALTESGNTDVTVTAEIERLNRQREQERAQLEFLHGPLMAAAEARDAEAKAAEDLKKQEEALARQRERDAGIYERAIDAFIAYQESLQAIQDQKQTAIEASWAGYYDALAKETEAFAQAQQDLVARADDESAKLLQARADIHREADQAILKSVESYNAEMIRLHRRHQLEEKWLLLDHAAELHDLAVERDVAGFVAQVRAFERDRQQREEAQRLEDQERRAQLDAEQAGIRERQNARLAENAQALAALAARIAGEQAKLEAAHAARMAEIGAALDAELRQAEQAAQQQAAARAQAFTRQLADLNRQLSSETATRERYYAQWAQQAETHFAQFRGLLAQAGGVTGGATRLGQGLELPAKSSQGVSPISGEGGKIVVNQVVGQLVSAPQAKQIADKTANAILTQQQRWEQQRRRWR